MLLNKFLLILHLRETLEYGHKTQWSPDSSADSEQRTERSDCEDNQNCQLDEINSNHKLSSKNSGSTWINLDRWTLLSKFLYKELRLRVWVPDTTSGRQQFLSSTVTLRWSPVSVLTRWLLATGTEVTTELNKMRLIIFISYLENSTLMLFNWLSFYIVFFSFTRSTREYSFAQDVEISSHMSV